METKYIKLIVRGFRVTIPPEFRQGLDVGDIVEIGQEDGCIIITPLALSPKHRNKK